MAECIMCGIEDDAALELDCEGDVPVWCCTDRLACYRDLLAAVVGSIPDNV